MKEITPLPSFEDFRNENGQAYWWASDLLLMLGYKDIKSFQTVLDRATKALVSLGIRHYENIRAEQREINGQTVQDFKLTRFACYIAVMNGNPRKPEVAQAQAYFAQQARRFELLQDGEQFERLHTREELIDGNKSLASAAKAADVEDYAKFQNAGYLGMYNMSSWQLEDRRGIDRGKVLDYMSRVELAANLFRVTQTEERIKSRKIKGQVNLEQAHHDVGKEVRQIVLSNTGKKPEQLPVEQKITDVKKQLKAGHKKMTAEDNLQKHKK